MAAIPGPPRPLPLVLGHGLVQPAVSGTHELPDVTCRNLPADNLVDCSDSTYVPLPVTQRSPRP